MNLLTALLALALAAGSTPADLKLTPQKALSSSMDAYPRIASPATPETGKINEALGKADARVKNAARDCNRTDNWNAAQWRRAVSVPFRYGDFLTVEASDEWGCLTFSGASLSATTYDLTTGEPVDWRTLFEPRIAGDPAEAEAGDTSRLSTVVSPIMNEVYRRKVLIGMDPEDRGGCNDAFASRYTVMLWLDAENKGVGMQGMGFSPAFKACARPVTLTFEEVGQLRGLPRLTEALKAANAEHAWSADVKPAGRAK